MADCATILRSAIQNDLMAACFQAQATIDAAQAAARATVHAGKIQARAATNAGLFSFLTGVLAAGGGGLAYWAALRQIRLAERQHRDKVTAYRWHMVAVLGKLVEQTETARFRFHQLAGNQPCRPVAVDVPAEIKPEHWEDHALLGEEFVSRLVEANDALDRYSTACKNVEGKNPGEPYQPAEYKFEAGESKSRTNLEVLESWTVNMNDKCRTAFAMVEPGTPFDQNSGSTMPWFGRLKKIIGART